jgi:WhiB family redox-sensing transcriptional regulator
MTGGYHSEPGLMTEDRANRYRSRTNEKKQEHVMTSTQYSSGRQLSSLDRIMAIEGRPFETEAITPCRQSQPSPDNDLWFSPFRDKIRAIRACKGCPFIGRCGYNAVVNRAQYGVWGGISLPGSDATPDNLEDAYTYLLAQFERRRPIELGELAVPARPSTAARRRRCIPERDASDSESDSAVA